MLAFHFERILITFGPPKIFDATAHSRYLLVKMVPEGPQATALD